MAAVNLRADGACRRFGRRGGRLASQSAPGQDEHLSRQRQFLHQIPVLFGTFRTFSRIDYNFKCMILASTLSALMRWTWSVMSRNGRTSTFPHHVICCFMEKVLPVFLFPFDVDSAEKSPKPLTILAMPDVQVAVLVGE